LYVPDVTSFAPLCPTLEFGGLTALVFCSRNEFFGYGREQKRFRLSRERLFFVCFHAGQQVRRELIGRNSRMLKLFAAAYHFFRLKINVDLSNTNLVCL
jgi:hypothetical protein